MSVSSYNQAESKFSDMTDEILKMLPDFMTNYRADRAGKLRSRSLYAYITDIKYFFDYLIAVNPLIKDYNSITYDVLQSLTLDDFNDFLYHIRKNVRISGKVESLYNANVSRKVTSLKSLYLFLYRSGRIDHDPAALVEPDRTKKKKPIYLDSAEVNNIISNIENGTTLTKHELVFHGKTMLRDKAIITLLLNTGMRVSECVGLDLSDINLEQGYVHLIRKGAKEEYLKINAETCECLADYLAVRKMRKDIEGGHEKAVFISRNKTRITVRAVEMLVKKYCPVKLTHNKKITPHKLRSTYATALFGSGEDIAVVQKRLGHSDISTTMIYTAVNDEKVDTAGDKDLF